MKRIARTLVILTLASAAAAATAADTPFPSAGQDDYAQSQIFPNMDTYKKEHRDSVMRQAPVPSPSAGQEEYPLSSEFPDMQTYRSIHRNDPAHQATTPTFPYSVQNEASMADEGLVPGIAGVPPFAAPSQDGPVGATR